MSIIKCFFLRFPLWNIDYPVHQLYTLYVIITAIKLVAENPTTGSGWKNYEHAVIKKCGAKESMEEIKSCFMEEAFSLKEIIMNSTLPATFNHTFLFSSYGGMVHFLNLSKQSIQYLPDNTLNIYLNTSLRHFVGFYDPVFQQIMSGHPTTLPRTLMKVGLESGNFLIYLKVTFSFSVGKRGLSTATVIFAGCQAPQSQHREESLHRVVSLQHSDLY